jgi:hypothetical protein
VVMNFLVHESGDILTQPLSASQEDVWLLGVSLNAVYNTKSEVYSWHSQSTLFNGVINHKQNKINTA